MILWWWWCLNRSFFKKRWWDKPCSKKCSRLLKWMLFTSNYRWQLFRARWAAPDSQPTCSDLSVINKVITIPMRRLSRSKDWVKMVLITTRLSVITHLKVQQHLILVWLISWAHIRVDFRPSNRVLGPKQKVMDLSFNQATTMEPIRSRIR